MMESCWIPKVERLMTTRTWLLPIREWTGNTTCTAGSNSGVTTKGGLFRSPARHSSKPAENPAHEIRGRCGYAADCQGLQA